jgi:hypothetical protein
LELLLIRNYIPQRSFFIALGHDEEVELFLQYLSLVPLLGMEGGFTLIQCVPQL